MAAFFGNIKIRYKLYLLVIMPALSMIILEGIGLNEFWHDLNKDKQQELSKFSEIAYSLIKRQHQLVANGEKSKEQGISEALAELRSLRYNGNEYFFLIDPQHKMLMHPMNTSLEGKNLKDLQDTQGKYFIRELVNDVMQNGEGYVEYFWKHPGADEDVPKLSYGRLHPEWNLIVITGIYTDDI